VCLSCGIDGEAGEVNYVPKDAPKFIVFQDLVGGNYWWRLRSATRETLTASESGYAEKGACEQEVQRLKAGQYPDADVLDLTTPRYYR
jgi:uncharacterized protein YegP (UPF0339 family)